MAKVYLGLGSNLGDRKNNISSAIKEIENRIGSILDQSDLIETQPWGFESQNLFVNAVVSIETLLSPVDLLHETQKIEKDLGRTQKSTNTYHDRTIDIDILLYDNLNINTPELTIPHPLMEKRDFVMIPMNQILDRENQNEEQKK